MLCEVFAKFRVVRYGYKAKCCALRITDFISITPNPVGLVIPDFLPSNLAVLERAKLQAKGICILAVDFEKPDILPHIDIRDISFEDTELKPLTPILSGIYPEDRR